jgi:hypothetical protein
MSFTVLLLTGISVIVLAIVLILIIRKNITERNNLKPELTISVESDDDNFCGVKLINQGSGTAVIKNVQFTESNGNGLKHVSNSLDELFPFQKTYWNNNSTYDEERDYYLAGGESFYFGKLVKNKVVGRGTSYLKLKDIFDEKIKGINIKVEYNDVFEKPQRPYIFKK